MEEIKEKTHERIARLFNVKPGYVKSILKIGRTNPHYFERIRAGRYSVYKAYADCVAESRGEKQGIPGEGEAVNFEPVPDLTQVQDDCYVFKCSCGEEHHINLKQMINEQE